MTEAKKNRDRRANGKRLPIIRIGRCFKCNKLTIFTRKRAILCKKCHKQASYTANMQDVTKDYNSPYYRKKQKKIIAEQKWCQLCGTTENLTAHHIGGREDRGLVCLCDTCHKAYEKWAYEQKKLNKK